MSVPFLFSLWIFVKEDSMSMNKSDAKSIFGEKRLAKIESILGEIRLEDDIVLNMQRIKNFKKFVLRSIDRYIDIYPKYMDKKYSGEEIFEIYWMKGTDTIIWISTSIARKTTVVEFPKEKENQLDPWAGYDYFYDDYYG